ncbi:hypothetical protein BH18ACT3_BH18ACT3_01130 [soil metagenome]|jgi:thiol-disulfide isomerase/thioredoxin
MFAALTITVAACGSEDATPDATADTVPDAADDATADTVPEALPEFQGGPDPAIGMDAPAISGVDYSGQPSSFVPGGGRPTLLVFLAHWCGHCNAEIPRMIEWDANGGVPDNLDIVGISTLATDTRDKYPPGEWLDETGWEWPVIADDEEEYRYARLYGLAGTPYLVLVGADGKVMARTAGEKSAEELTEFVSPIAG